MPLATWVMLMEYGYLNDFDARKTKLLYHAPDTASRVKWEGHPQGVPLQVLIGIRRYGRKLTTINHSGRSQSESHPAGRDSYLNTKMSILENRPIGCFGSGKMPDLRVWYIVGFHLDLSINSYC